jgi:hypothetical protein
MFTAKQLKERMDQQPFRPFKIRMSNGESYDIPNHDSAWVLRDSVEIGLDPDAEGMVALIRRCAILHIASIEDISTAKAA